MEKFPHLAAALDAGLDHAALYPGRSGALSNHLPMVLHATAELGGDAATLDRHRAHWASRVVPMDAAERSRVAYLEQEIRAKGTQRVLAAQLPDLLCSPQAGAFHGMIRLSHAWLAGHDAECARALAAWEAGVFSVGALSPSSVESEGWEDLPAVLAAAMVDPSLAFRSMEGTITADLLAVAGMPGFGTYAHGPAAPSDAALTLAALAEASLAVYLACHSFTALHLMTGVYAFRVLSAVAPSGEVTACVQRRALWQAWLAAWVSMGRPAPAFDAVTTGIASEAQWVEARADLLALLGF